MVSSTPSISSMKESQHPIALGLKPRCALCVIDRSLGVLSAINLDCEPLLETEEVDDGAKGMLPPKPVSG